MLGLIIGIVGPLVCRCQLGLSFVCSFSKTLVNRFIEGSKQSITRLVLGTENKKPSSKDTAFSISSTSDLLISIIWLFLY